MSAFPARPAVPARPAAYVRNPHGPGLGDAATTALRNAVSSLAQEELGWPEPVVYTDAGRPGSQLAALAEAISGGRHDGVFATRPSELGEDLLQIEAFDRLCRQHGVSLRFRPDQELSSSSALFDVIRDVRDFTVTDEHLLLLRRAYVVWEEGELGLGAPLIDPKRPYGNSQVYADIAEILGLPDSDWADEELIPSLDSAWRFIRLHVETAIALQIALATGEFRAGRYVRDDDQGDSRRWQRTDG